MNRGEAFSWITQFGKTQLYRKKFITVEKKISNKYFYLYLNKKGEKATFL
jgi:hypothetical protein